MNRFTSPAYNRSPCGPEPTPGPPDRPVGPIGAVHLGDAVDKCEDTRLSLEMNVTEDLALTALSVRLEQLVGASE